jgi:hypothetical protein
LNGGTESISCADTFVKKELTTMAQISVIVILVKHYSVKKLDKCLIFSKISKNKFG